MWQLEPRWPAVLMLLKMSNERHQDHRGDNNASSCLKRVIGQFVIGFGEDESLGQAGEEAQRVGLPHLSLAVAQESVAVQKNRLGARKSTLVLSHSRNPAKT